MASLVSGRCPVAPGGMTWAISSDAAPWRYCQTASARATGVADRGRHASTSRSNAAAATLRARSSTTTSGIERQNITP